MEDKLVWPFVSLGIYSAKSGYNFLAKEKALESQLTASTDQLQVVWKNIWGCRVPNKVKSLPWRACKNSLPVKTNLVCRNVLSEESYDQCKQFPEDVIHALWACPEVSVVWNSDAAWTFRDSKVFTRFVDLVRYVVEEKKDLETFAMYIWTLWFRRNRLQV